MPDNIKVTQHLAGRKAKTALAFFLPVAILAAVILTVMYREEVKPVRNNLKRQAASTVYLQKNKIGNNFSPVIADLLFFAEQAQLLKLFASPGDHREALEKDLALFSRVSRIYDQVRILDSSGMESIRINLLKDSSLVVPDNQLQFKGDRYYFKETFSLKKGEVYVSPLDLNIENDRIEQPLKPTIRFGTPIFDTSGRKQGIIVFNYLAENLIRNLKELSSGSPGQHMLLNRDGYWLVSDTAADEWGFMYENKRQKTFGNSYPEAWRTINAADNGQFITSDGLFTFATVHPLSSVAESLSAGSIAANGTPGQDYRWKIVSFIPAPLLHAETSIIRNKYISIFIVLLLLLAVGSWIAAEKVFARRQNEIDLLLYSENLEKEVHKRTAELEETAKSLQNELHARNLLEIEQHKLEEQLNHAQRMDSIGTLAGGIAHDFNNILTGIIGYGTIALKKIAKDDPQRHFIQRILEASDRAVHLTRELLQFSRKQVLDRKPVDLNKVVAKAEKFLNRVIGEDITIKSIFHKTTLPVLADEFQLEQVLVNLATNARDSMSRGGIVTVSTGMTYIDEDYATAHGPGMPGTYAIITVSDTGGGMDTETQKRIFEPFFTTKEIGKGTGLGLAVVYGIVKQHDGLIHVDSEPAQGTCVKIYLPLIASGTAEDNMPSGDESPARGRETILLAEDDDIVRNMSATVLTEYGYTVIEAVNGAEAVRKFRENADAIQLLLFDMIMPEMNGKDASDEIKKLRPDIKTIFASGYALDIVQQKMALEEGLQLVSKPIPPMELLRKVRSVLDT